MKLDEMAVHVTSRLTRRGNPQELLLYAVNVALMYQNKAAGEGVADEPEVQDMVDEILSLWFMSKDIDFQPFPLVQSDGTMKLVPHKDIAPYQAEAGERIYYAISPNFDERTLTKHKICAGSLDCACVKADEQGIKYALMATEEEAEDEAFVWDCLLEYEN